MEEITDLLAKHVGQWAAIYVAGAFPNVVGGKVSRVFAHCLELDQEHVLAYVPFERIIYVTLPKVGVTAGPAPAEAELELK